MIIAPFSLESLPKAALTTRRRDLVAAAGGMDALAHALTETLRAPVALRFARTGAGGVTIAFAVGEHTVVVDAEPALAREVIGRALSRAAGITDPNKPLPADLHGAFAAVLHHALRKAKVGPLRVAKPRSDGPAIEIALAIDVAGATFGARVLVPDAIIVPPAPPRTEDFPIALPLVAASCLATRAEIEALAPGDVFVPPRLLAGSALALVAPRAERGLAVELTPDQRLVLRRLAPMPADTNTTLEVALDAPVVVRVELGAVEMKAREWAALAEGDVISLQRKLGEPAILRIAGNEVARGELVQVDGEYGIRITSTNR